MLNTELGAVLAVIRRPPDLAAPPFDQDNSSDGALVQSLKSLRSLIFNPQQEWCTLDPTIYLSPFLDVIQSDDAPAAATGIALSTVLKILSHRVFDERSPGAKEAINSLVLTGITGCRLEKTDRLSEEAVMMRILQVLGAIIKHPASIHLSDDAVCTLLNTCFQVVQQSTSRGDLLQRSARYTMHEIVQVVFANLPDVEATSSDSEEEDEEEVLEVEYEGMGYGIRSMVDIFHFLCSLLNVVEVVENEGMLHQTADEDVQLFSLVMINSAIELGGDAIAKHPKLLRMVQDDLFHHLIHYGTRSRPLVLAMICSAVLNIYKFLRKLIRLQLEAFFDYVLLKVASLGSSIQLQEVALEAIINFCRQPNFIIEAYVNYDCDPVCRNIFQDIGKLLCNLAFPGASASPSIQIQAFEGMVIIIHTIADNIDKEGDVTPSGPYPIEIIEYRPFWEDKPKDDFETWIEYLRFRKAQKKKILIAANHYNRDDRKGLEYLKIRSLVSDPPDPKAYASFFRFVPGLDRTSIGEYLGDPDEFHLKVLREFTDTFEFSGMVLDTALRTYLAAFRLPGESQKIHRIIEAFSEKFYDQRSTDIFATKDAVLILCYSLIMLNTDQHNVQVKKKMTEEEFIRNNRAINGGKDLPREYLSELFHSIATNEIQVLGQSSMTLDMNSGKWIELMNRSKLVQPFITSEFDRRLGRDMFAYISGPAVASLSAFFEHADEDELFQECIRGLISIARIAQYGLEDTLDELIATFSKFTTLLNPYATAEETLFGFSNDMKPRMATLAVFTIANSFGKSIREGWRNIIDCLLKLKRLKLLPQSTLDLDSDLMSSPKVASRMKSESGVVFSFTDSKFGSHQGDGMINRFSHFLSLESKEDMMSLGMSEFEQNIKVIKQCRIGSIFSNTSKIPDDALLNLGRSLIFAAGGKGQKFSTPIEEEDTVIFCWDLIVTIALANIHRFHNFWYAFHDNLIGIVQFPMFSPVPFAEKAIVGLLKICVSFLSMPNEDRLSEECIFKSINLMCKLDMEILDTCCETITNSISKILVEYPENLHTYLGWKSVLQLLSITGRHPETYDQGVETLITLMSTQVHLSRTNYMYVIDCAFGFVALRNSPLEKNIRILDLLADSTSLLVQWYRDSVDSGSNFSIASNASTSSEENARSPNFAMNCLLKLGEAFRKTSLARREEIRNHAILALKNSFLMIEELDFSPLSCFNCNQVILAMVDNLQEKMVEYSRRKDAEREMRSMEGTLGHAMDLLTDIFILCLKPMASSPEFRTFWLGTLRRMDTCMKANLGEHGQTRLQEIIPGLLKKMITMMKEEKILVPIEGDDLWETTYIQIQWIAPALKEELFPEVDF